MDRIRIFGRIVYPITTPQGQNDYYDHMNYWHSCVKNLNLRHSPTRENAREYLRLVQDKHPTLSIGDIIRRKRERILNVYENRYDWRPKKSEENNLIGLISPTGEQLLPIIFEDVFTQVDVIKDRPNFIPVSNGNGWALVSLGANPVLMTEFRYNTIIPERWERRIFFVQDKETMKWGALRAIWQSANAIPRNRHALVTIEPLMPCIADDIYEDQLMTDCEPTLFFMTRIEDKIGILTDYGYSKIIYDRYETDDTDCSFRLIRNDRKRARRANWWNPDGKDLFINLKRRTYKNAEKKKTSTG